MSKKPSPSSGSGLQPDGVLSIPIDRLCAAAKRIFMDARAGDPLLKDQDLYLLAVRQALQDPTFNWTHRGQRQSVKSVLYSIAYTATMGNRNLLD